MSAPFKPKAASADERAAAIRLAASVLRTSGPTATGMTLMLPDGEALYMSIDDARAMAGTAPARGRA
jgi:hypothetical protein